MKLLDGSEYVMDLSQVRTRLFPSIYGPGASLTPEYLTDSKVDQKQAEKIARTELSRAIEDSIMTSLKNGVVRTAIS